MLLQIKGAAYSYMHIFRIGAVTRIMCVNIDCVRIHS